MLFIQCNHEFILHANVKKWAAKIQNKLELYLIKSLLQNMVLFDWKIKPKTIHFNIWSIWPFGHIG
jgi:hypothetical protein